MKTKVFHNVPRYLTLLLVKAKLFSQIFIDFFSSTTEMEYALPETTIGEKWESKF